jgi:hypothetical protein
MRVNCKAVIHFLRMQWLGVLFNCIALLFSNRSAMRLTSLASFATDIVDRGELHIGGGCCAQHGVR